MPGRAFHIDHRSVRPGNHLRNGEAKAGAGIFAMGRVSLVKTFENVGESFGRNARPRIPDGQDHLALTGGGRDHDGASRPVEFQGIVDEDSQEAPNPCIVGQRHAGFRGKIGADADAP